MNTLKQLCFLKVDGKTPEVVLSSEGLHSTTIVKDKIGIINGKLLKKS